MMSSEPLLEALRVSKRFAGVQALDAVTAQFHAGEVVAVMGENGAGKSTLMKVLAGIYQPDSGEVRWRGKPVKIAGARQAGELGIAFIHQELNLCGNLTVAENIYLGREPRKAGWWLDRGEMRRRTSALLERIGLAVDPDTPVESLPVGRRQMVEIARSLTREARLVIMDEPTSSLTPAEAGRLFEVVRDLKRDGITVVFISHRLAEVQAVADRVIVLRDGKNSGALDGVDVSPERIVRLMVGRDLDVTARRPPPGTAGQNTTPTTRRVRLEVRNLRTRAWPGEEVDFSVRAGEITGMAGLVGAGRTEVARAVAGVDRPAGGEVLVDGRRLASGSPSAAVRAGLALAPEDRKDEGLFLEMSIRENIALPGFGLGAAGPGLDRAGFVRPGKMEALASRLAALLGIRTTDTAKEAGLLSGGNQQKVVLAKWLALSPGVFILDEPTRGVDVGAKAEIHRVVEELAAGGAAVLVISSDLEEILRLSDRVLVMRTGRLAGEVPHALLSEESIMNLAAGVP